MRAAILRAIFPLLIPTTGCSTHRAVNPYYAFFPNLPGSFKQDVKFQPHLHFGYCDEHGELTNHTTDYEFVDKWVEAHNNRYHRDGKSLHWAKVHTEP